MFVKRSLKIFGCLRIESARFEPDSTSWRIWMRARLKTLFSCCEPRISRHCTSGRPASIMTENWRVKMAMSCGGTLPPNFGKASSFPFSLTAVTTICWRRSVAMTASFVSATSTPAVSPARLLPFHSNVGIVGSLPLRVPARSRRADRRAHSLRLQRAGAAGDHLLQLVGVRRARQRHLQRNLFLEVERGQRLVEGLHPVLRLSGLHHRVDLVDLVLADEIADGRVRHEDLHGHHAAVAVGLRQQRLAEDPLEDERELGAD